MCRFRYGALLLIAVVSIAAPFCLAAPSVDDANVILDLKRAWNATYFPDWNTDNITNLCIWTGIRCDVDERVSEIELPYFDRPPEITGTIPASIRNLTHLQSINLNSQNIAGEIPQELFLLPNIFRINLEATGVRVTFPPTVSSSLQYIGLNRVLVTSPLPETINWTQFRRIDLARSALSCPLPQSFITALKQERLRGFCDLGGNRLPIDSNSLLCGQVPVTDIVCISFPSVNAPDSLSSTNQPLPPGSFVAEFPYMQIEFYNNTAHIFLANNTRAGRFVYRQEFASLQFSPFAQSESPSYLVTMFNRTRFYAAEFTSPNEWRVRGTIDGANLTQDIIFVKRDLYDRKIKFSTEYRNTGRVWNNTAMLYRANFAFSMIYKAPHSAATGPTVQCFRQLDNIRKDQICNSSISTASAYIDFQLGAPFPELVTILDTPNITISFTYVATATVDNTTYNAATVDDSILRVLIDRYFHPVGYTRNIQAQTGVNSSLLAPPGPIADQYSAISFRVIVPLFNDRFIYDPDVELSPKILLSQLFDVPPEASSSPSTKAQADILATAFPVAAVVAPIVVVVVIFVGVLFFAKVIFPYMQARDNATPEDTLADVDAPTQPPKGKWHAAKASSVQDQL